MIYPDHTLEDALRNHGADVGCLWELRGPKNTDVAWIVCYGVRGLGCGSVVLVETYKSGGWEAFTTNDKNDTQSTIADVLSRVGLANG